MNQRLARGMGSLALVLFGVALGVAGDRLILRHHGPARVAAPSPEEQHRTALLHFQELFDLDEEQVARIDEVFRRHQSIVVESWSAVEPRLRTAIESVHMSMQHILRPEQRAAFHEWLREQGEHSITIIQHGGEGHTPPAGGHRQH